MKNPKTQFNGIGKNRVLTMEKRRLREKQGFWLCFRLEHLRLAAGDLSGDGGTRHMQKRESLIISSHERQRNQLGLFPRKFVQRVWTKVVKLYTTFLTLCEFAPTPFGKVCQNLKGYVRVCFLYCFRFLETVGNSCAQAKCNTPSPLPPPPRENA